MMKSSRIVRAAVLTAVLTFAACTGNDQPDADTGSAVMDSMAGIWRDRQASAESLTKAAPEVSDVVKQLGTERYDVADADIEAAVKREAEKTADCYAKARRDIDSNLSVVLYVMVNYGGAGWDMMRVERWNGTSVAGNAVVSCINMRAKAEWKLPEKGVKPGAHIVKLVYTPPDSSKGG